jgi:hypothetical protein
MLLIVFSLVAGEEHLNLEDRQGTISPVLETPRKFRPAVAFALM